MGRKQKAKKARKGRTFMTDAPVMPTLRQSIDPASKDPFLEDGSLLAREATFSAETIQHLIERIKAI